MLKRVAPGLLVLGALILTIIASPGPSPGLAQNTLRAAAVVNDEVISVLDLAMRTRLAILASGLKNTPEVRKRFQNQVLRSLIDERLQLQEARRLDISVDESQLEDAIGRLASQNKMSREQFLAVLSDNDILPNALFDQIRSKILWNSLIQRRLQPSVEVSDEEVEEVVARLQSSQGHMQYRLSEIMLSVDSMVQDDEVRRAAERLVEQLRQGANFAALARQFSQSATASVGGDLGWIEEEQLPEELADALGRMRSGQLEGPISTFGGYYILLLRDQRRISAGDATMSLKQLLLAFPPDASPEQQQQASTQAAELRARIDGCEGFDDFARQYGSPGSGDLGTVKMSEMPRELREIVGPLPVGQPSAAIRVPAGFSILLVCSRNFDGIDREEIRQTLVNQRLDMLARRYLRDLRRSASVDVRL